MFFLLPHLPNMTLKNNHPQIAPHMLKIDMIFFKIEARWTIALELLQQAWRSQLRLDTVCLNATMSTCAKRGRWRSAAVLLEEFGKRRLTPDPLSFSSLTSALATCLVIHVLHGIFRLRGGRPT